MQKEVFSKKRSIIKDLLKTKMIINGTKEIDMMFTEI